MHTVCTWAATEACVRYWQGHRHADVADPAHHEEHPPKCFLPKVEKEVKITDNGTDHADPHYMRKSVLANGTWAWNESICRSVQ